MNLDNGYVFGKNWFKNYQNTLLVLLNGDLPLVGWLVKFWFRAVLRINSKHSDVAGAAIAEIYPNAIRWFAGYALKDGKIVAKYKLEARSHNKYSKRLLHAFYPIWWLMHQWDMFIANNFAPQYNLGFDTLTVYPEPGVTVDGRAWRSSATQTWADLRVGAGNGNGYTDTNTGAGNCQADTTSNTFKFLSRGIFLFDTSALPTSPDIDSAVVSFYVTSRSTGLAVSENIVSSNPASNTVLADSDYANLGSTKFSTAVAISAMSDSAYQPFTLNASGEAAISDSGITKLGVRLEEDIDNSAPTWSSNQVGGWNIDMSDQTGTSTDPKLVIEYNTAVAPTVTTETPAKEITSVSAEGGGNVTNDGGGTVSERGVVWGTSPNPTIAGNKQASGSGTGVFTGVQMTGLTPDTHYYYRAYATNEAGTAYGADVEFDTLDAVISGNCTLNGSPVENAVITLINSDTDAVVSTTLSDASGDYSFTGLDITVTYHVTAEYIDGYDMYNSRSLPFMTPEEV